MSELSSELMVVETDTTAYLGTIEWHDRHIIIRNGIAGRPPLIELGDIDMITPAAQHPDVQHG